MPHPAPPEGLDAPAAPLVYVSRSKVLPYLAGLPLFAPRAEELAFVLTGTVPTELFRVEGDVDMAIVIETELHDKLAEEPDWQANHSGETRLGALRVRHQTTTFDTIEENVRQLSDSYIYDYGNSVVLYDPHGHYGELLGRVTAALPELRRQRLEGKLDLLRRRYWMLEAALRDRDVLAAAGLGLELLRLAAKVTALLDDVPFNPRRHLFLTALSGRLGYRLERAFRIFLLQIGQLSELRPDTDVSRLDLPVRLAGLINTLSEEARGQEFRVELDRPDHRCAEA